MSRFHGWFPEDIAVLRFVAGREWTFAKTLPAHLPRASLKKLVKHGMVDRTPISDGSHFYWHTISWRGKKLLEQCNV
jgi:hypothetical protein